MDLIILNSDVDEVIEDLVHLDCHTLLTAMLQIFQSQILNHRGENNFLMENILLQYSLVMAEANWMYMISAFSLASESLVPSLFNVATPKLSHFIPLK